MPPVSGESGSPPPGGGRSWLELAGVFLATQLGLVLYAPAEMEPSLGYNGLSTIAALGALWDWLWH